MSFISFEHHLLEDYWFSFDRRHDENWINQVQHRTTSAIMYVAEGDCRFTEPNGHAFVFHPHDIVYLPKGFVYTFTSDRHTPLHFYICNFTLQYSQTLPIQPVSFSLLNNSREELIINIMKDLIKYTSYSGSRFSLKVRSLLYSLFYELEKSSYISDGISDKRIQDSVNYIKQHFSEELSIDDLAGMQNLSKTHYRRLFLQITGVPPHDFIIGLRINEAKELLRTSSCSIGEISRIVGFHDIYYFSRAFKKSTGFSPNNWKKQSEE